MTDLIDTTEMYLRTIYELIEDGIAPMRARIAEQLAQSGPTVSQTVARMERDGLVVVGDDRVLHLTQAGHDAAVRVMRKHRLAERLLIDVIGLDLPHVHEEACRWEHVMSDRVERKVLELVADATVSPYGNPIPGLEELGADATPGTEVLVSLADLATESVTRVTLVRIGENPQAIEGFLQLACEIGLLPGTSLELRAVTNGVHVTTEAGAMEIPLDAARHIFAA